MGRFKKILLTIGLLFAFSTSLYAGQYYYVGVDGIVHCSGLTVVSGLSELTIDTNTVITGNLDVIGIITAPEVEFGTMTIANLYMDTINVDTMTVNNLATIEDLTVNGVISFPNNSLDGSDIKDNEITSEELAPDVEFTTTTVTRQLVDYISPRDNANIKIESDLDMDSNRILNSPDLVDIADSTDTLKSELNAETVTRISEDDLLADSTTQLQTNIDNEETARINRDILIGAATGQLQIDLATEISDRISEDNLIGATTDQIRTDFEAYDFTLNTSTSTLRSDLSDEETARINQDNLLGESTGQLQIDLDSEIALRISEDDLISSATEQIRIDFEAYDSTLNTSTSTLRTDLGTVESAIINLETSTSTLEGRLDTTESDITNLETSTSTIEGNLATEISNRISEDDLISSATGQIRIDFEAYDSTLDTSTTTLRSDLSTAETAITNLETSTSTLEGRLDTVDTDITNLETSTSTIEGNLISEIASRISEDDLISSATGQIRIDFEAYDSTLDTSTTTLRSDLSTAETNITNLETSTSTLEGRLDTAETDITNLETSTSTIEGNLVSEIALRISEDNLISSATGQIRIDFEAYDSTLDTSTTTLRTDLGTAETNITNLETSTSTLEGRLDTVDTDITNLETSTSTIEGNLVSEIASRISEDDLISTATGQIRIDFEAYDSTLDTSTTTLRSDLGTEETARINQDDLLGESTGQLQIDLTTEINIRINELASLPTTYLGISDKADDSDLLDGYNYDYFVDTVTAQNIGGDKTFDDDIIVDGNIYSSSWWLKENDPPTSYGMRIYYYQDKLRMYMRDETENTYDYEYFQAKFPGTLYLGKNAGGASLYFGASAHEYIKGTEINSDVRIGTEGSDRIIVTSSSITFSGMGIFNTSAGYGVSGQVLQTDGINITWGTPFGGGDMLRSIYDIGEDGTVDDSEKLDGQAGSYYAVKANVISSTDTLQSNIDIEIVIRINEISSLTTTYLGISDKADDSDLLDGYNYTHFVDTTTNQTIGGVKTFEEIISVADFHSDAIWLSGDMKIYSDGDTLKMYQKNETANTYEFEYNLLEIPGSLYLGKNLTFQYLYFGATTDEYIRGDASNNIIKIGTGGFERVSITDSSTTFSGDVSAIGYEVAADTFTGVFIGNTSSSTYAADSDLLDAHDSLYFAIKADVISSTDTLQTNIGNEETARISQDDLLGASTGQLQIDLDSEIASRISEDDLISAATGQIRIDFEAYDSTLDISTSTLRTDLGTAETNITNLETSTSTLEGRLDTAETDITNLETSTSTIEGNLVSEIASRISEDDLISSATGQIRLDVTTSTDSLRSDLTIETNIRINEITSLTTTYLGITDIAVDSSLWKTIDIDTTTLVTNDLFRFNGSDFVRIASGTVVGSYLKQDFTWETPSGTGDMLRSVYDIGEDGTVDDSELLDGYNYTHFVDTVTAQNIGGDKTFEDDVDLDGQIVYQIDKYIVCAVFTSAGINAAIDLLGSGGGEVYLPEGNYSCNTTIVIDYSSTTLIGAGAGTILDASAGQDTPAVIDTNDKDYVTIRNLTIIGSAGDAITSNLIGDGDNSDYLTVENCYLVNSDNHAIHTGGNEVKILNNKILIPDNDGWRGSGSDCLFEGNTVKETGEYGLFSTGIDVEILKNRFNSTGYQSIRADNARPTIINNKVVYCDYDAIWVSNANAVNAIVANNTILNTTDLIGRFDITIGANRAVVVGNNCYGDGTSAGGINLSTADYCVVVGNISDYHTVAGIREYDSCQNNLIFGNNFLDNTPYILDGLLPESNPHPSQTSAQLATITPRRVGEPYWNSTTGMPVISSGTAAGDFMEYDGSNFDGS